MCRRTVTLLLFLKMNDKPQLVRHVLEVGLCFVDDLDRNSLITEEGVCNTDAEPLILNDYLLLHSSLISH